MKDEKLQDLTQQEGILNSKNDARKYPKTSQCAGGNGNNSASKTQVTGVKENKQCNQATAGPSGNGYGNNSQGFGDDGNDPPEKRISHLKPHYLDIVAFEKGTEIVLQFFYTGHVFFGNETKAKFQ